MCTHTGSSIVPAIPVGCSSGFRDSACVVLCKDQAQIPHFECKKMGQGTRFGQARKESPASMSFRPEPSQGTPDKIQVQIKSEKHEHP